MLIPHSEAEYGRSFLTEFFKLSVGLELKLLRTAVGNCQMLVRESIERRALSEATSGALGEVEWICG
jgi:hypothetical protein